MERETKGTPDVTKKIERSAFLKGTAALGLAGVAATSLPVRMVKAASGQNLVYWNLFSGGDGGRMITMEKDFTKANPTIGLKATTLTWGTPYYTKLTTSTVAGKAPDVAIAHMTRLPAYAPVGLLEPFDLAALAKVDITPSKFVPLVWNKGNFGGKQYAIPLDTHPFVNYYNTEICKKAGLTDASGKLKPLVGAAAWMGAFKAVQKVTGKYALGFSTVNDVTPWRLFYSLYTQAGGKVLSADGKSVLIDTAKATKVLDFIGQLGATKIVSPSAAYADSIAQFSSGKVGFMWQGEWESTTFKTSKTPFDMGLFPNIFGSYATQGDSHSFVIPRQKSQDPAKLDAVLMFISFLLKDSLVWAAGGHIPAYLPIATSAAYKALSPQSHYAGEAKYVTYDPTAWWCGSGSQFETDAGSYFESLIQGHSTSAKAVSQLVADIQKYINTPQPG
jgi:multiple sugar transport system substrate-binding protein